ncbi:DUF2786 domain-containing protein [Nocardioides sp. STR2]|uniref:DUF2786 domain-containing protein n=1 Tax=Nocardioides pini TaxID=2975053 RepID=A0ABT4CCY2_9ACTN|nr:DUF2786 domain-containing protein [Nocardioides pini]MCY4726820.1 DUF2786 domain-containing protein [Nocardioides pini]
MGANSRKRKAARQRTQERNEQPGEDPTRAGESWDAARAYAVVEAHVHHALRQLIRKKLSSDEVARVAQHLVTRAAPHPRHVVEIVLHDLAHVVLGHVVDGGWSPSDLGELVMRNLGPAHLPLLATALREHERSSACAQAWRDAVDALDEPALALGPGEPVAALLGLVALLNVAPRLTDAIAGTAEQTGPEHPKLARVRALLAKAESTEFDEEAEALSAKAQELISRYALDQLLDDGPASGRSDLRVRRLWLDRPYVRAKTLLVSAVASANRCRAAGADQLGFSVVVGSASDLDAVELMVTSLLVQADAAMLRHGRRTSATGTTRMKSFRQSFLTAYALRIADRLERANIEAARATGADLLPVLRSQEAKVAEEFVRLVPHSVGRSTTVSNSEGWTAGLAAADLAQLGVNGRLDHAG